ETPEWLKQVTAPKTDSEDVAASSDSPTDAEDEAAEPPAPERPASTPAEADHRRTVRGPPDAGAILALAPPTQVRERLKAIKKRAPSEVTLAEQLGLKFRRVVVDPGHGGHDTGTIGADGTREKDVALAIAKKLRTVLTEQGLEVVLTRET